MAYYWMEGFRHSSIYVRIRYFEYAIYANAITDFVMPNLNYAEWYFCTARPLTHNRRHCEMSHYHNIANWNYD